MKQLFTRSTQSAPASTSRFAKYLVALILVLVPLHGLLTVWGSALVGHYLALRAWDDVLLVGLLVITVWWLAKDAALRVWLAGSLLVRLILAYGGLTLLLGCISLAKGDVTPQALVFGVLLNLRFLAWFLAVLIVARRSPWLARQWPRLLLIPAAVVVVFAALQFTVLPHDFLAHFGYDAVRNIAPIETINHNTHYIRVQSTLRGANPLGAYLVVVVSALGVLFVRGKRRVICGVFAGVALFALYASGSRSAWIGTVISLAVIAWLQLKTTRSRIILGGAGLAVAALAAAGFLVLHNNAGLQNAVLHTQTHSAVSVSSNDAHLSALRSGLSDVWHQPLGDGPGTAGPASDHNGDHPVRIAENYYVQIAQETGWLGLALFAGIVALVGMELYQRIGRSHLALVLFASLVGISFVGLLSHVWTDDTLAFVWWGLAGVALAEPLKAKREV